MLGYLLHAPRGPFYSPKAARNRWRPIKESQTCLLSGGAPDSPVHHRTATVACPVPISFLFWRRRPLQLRVSWRTGHCPVHTGQSGAHYRPLELPRVARGLRGRPLAQTTVGSPDSPMNYSHVAFFLFSRTVSSPWTTHRTVRCTTRQSGEL
jgi:hypothetical protein